jgi:hypothetical protein
LNAPARGDSGRQAEPAAPRHAGRVHRNEPVRELARPHQQLGLLRRPPQHYVAELLGFVERFGGVAVAGGVPRRGVHLGTPPRHSGEKPKKNLQNNTKVEGPK